MKVRKAGVVAALVAAGVLMGAGKCDSTTPCEAIIEEGGRGGIPRENSQECRDAEKRRDTRVKQSQAAASSKAAAKTKAAK